LAPLEGLRRARLTADLRAAAERGAVFHLWWHPHNFGTNLAENMATLEHVVDEVVRLRRSHGFESMTMSEAAGAY
jgi:hypothetical protein